VEFAQQKEGEMNLVDVLKYGKEYALDDFVVYMYYGHKREHGAQVAGFHDRLV
jgi:hypothetical protein